MSSDAGPVTAADLVHARLAAQLQALDRELVAVRAGHPEGVHQARIACRRLRSALATFRPLVDRDVTDPIREELRWLGLSLSDSRDRYVVGQRLLHQLADEPLALTAGPVASRLRSTYLTPAEVPEALDSERFVVLRDRLGVLVDDPPWTGKADRPAAKVARRRVRAEVARVRARYDALGLAADHDVAMHDLRKAAKRLRYAAETWEPVGGDDAHELVLAAKLLTSHLGDRQDTIVSRAHLAVLARQAHAAGEPTFTYGRLHAREQLRAEAMDAELPDLWDRFTDVVRGLD